MPILFLTDIWTLKLKFSNSNGMKYLFYLFLLIFPFNLTAQTAVTGYVRNTSTNEAIPRANVVIGGKGAATNSRGYFVVENLADGEYILTVTVVGYSKYQQRVLVKEGKANWVDVRLAEDKIQLDGIVVSATRSENRISEIPGRVSLVTPERLSLIAAQTTDEYLSLISGVQVSRSFGLYSHKSSVTMRGLSGNEQARTLIMIDGIPVNKADGGSVNWNLISTGDIERIEVVKGPGSALYGGNAMGGVINVINRRPRRNFEGNVSVDYGTYATRGVKAKLAGRTNINRDKSFYWAANTTYSKSDGYITQSDADRLALSEYVTKSCFEDKALNLRAGFENGEKIHAGVDFTLYDDMRGTGEKYIQPDGNRVDHDTYQLRTAVSGKSGRLSWSASAFYLRENYKKVNEWVKDDYTWYNVSSYRTDYGLMSSFAYNLKNHSFIAGFDARNGEVDASDIYYTSTDKVDNNGKMDFYGFYLQDEISTFSSRVKVLLGARYDLSRFYDGAFIIHNPSAETAFMDQYQFSGLGDEAWGAFSPRISVQYKPSKNLRIYTGYSRGFRPSVLDDLCRSGRVRGGFKVANPNLKPEYLDNFEVGSDVKPVNWLKLSSSVYYSVGTDFLYYVSTGDSIDMGFGDRPIMIRSNISDVKIYGVEFDFTASPVRYLSLFGNYTFNSSKISDYKPLTSADPVDLNNKYLTDVPKHSFALGVLFQSKIVNAGVTGKYVGEMYVNDQNVYDEIVQSDVYPSAFTVDARLTREFYRHITVSVNVQNIFDEEIYDSKGAVGPGRFTTVDLGVRF